MFGGEEFVKIAVIEIAIASDLTFQGLGSESH